ncbi:MAG: DMT family transporter [Planctomycetota bacterium]
MPRAPLRAFALTATALVAFAGNSLLCRAALRGAAIDPVDFTALRLVGGALVLAPFARARAGHATARWSGAGAAALFVYALAFSLAYVTLGAGMGALLLFGAVQATMLAAGFARGERLRPLQALGFAAAVAGLVVQVLPGLDAPDPLGAALMVLAGIAWGVYSLLGRHVTSPRTATARNFALAVPAALLALPFAARTAGPQWHGVALALASGAVTSGLGYVVWYAALPHLRATTAALVQLAVPALAAAGGVLAFGEQWSARAALAAALTLGGIATAVLARRR